MDVSNTYNEHIMPGPTLCQTLLRRSSENFAPWQTATEAHRVARWPLHLGDPSQLHPVVKFRFFERCIFMVNMYIILRVYIYIHIYIYKKYFPNYIYIIPISYNLHDWVTFQAKCGSLHRYVQWYLSNINLYM